MRTISLVIPVYNEQKRIKKTIGALSKGFRFPYLKLEKVIFVDDGSTDNTLSILKRNKDKLGNRLKADVVLVTYRPNRGKGYAVKTGMLKSDSDYTLFLDADMATPLSEIEKFIPLMKKGSAVIVGTRKNGKSTVIEHQPLYRELMGKIFTLLSKLMLNTWVTDFTCGFKAFSRTTKDEIFTRSIIDRWGYDSEILFLARKLGNKINEKAVIWSDDRNSKVKVLRAALTSFSELLKIRFYDISGKYHLGCNFRFLLELKDMTQ